MEPVFKDLKILELASVLAGPAVGQFFAESGADVVKVEPAQGDVTRSWRSPGEPGPESAYFTSVNWGKRSICLDLTSPDDRMTLDQLIKRADIMLTSFRPGKDRELALDYDSVTKINSSLIYGQISGYGLHADRVGYDAVLQAESGFMYLNSSPGNGPQKMPVALIDILAAHQLKEGLLVGLIRKMKTGEGAHISVSLLDTALSSLANQAANYLTAGQDPRPQGSLHPNIAPYGEIVTTRDNREIILAVGNDRQFSALCTLLNLDGLPADPNYNTNVSRVENRTSLLQLILSRVSKLSADEFLSACHTRGIPAGEVRMVSQALQDSTHLQLSGEYLRGLRTFVANGLPVSLHLSPPPGLGQHAREIRLDWLGEDPE